MKNIQNKIKKFTQKYNLETTPEHRFIDLVSEIGEAGKELLKMTDYGTKEYEFRKELSEELGDVLFSLVTLANKFNIDLEDSLNKVLEKYEKRFDEKKNIGSG